MRAILVCLMCVVFFFGCHAQSEKDTDIDSDTPTTDTDTDTDDIDSPVESDTLEDTDLPADSDIDSPVETDLPTDPTLIVWSGGFVPFGETELRADGWQPHAPPGAFGMQSPVATGDLDGNPSTTEVLLALVNTVDPAQGFPVYQYQIGSTTPTLWLVLTDIVPELDPTFGSRSMAIVDFDGDGDGDIFMTNNYGWLLENNGGGRSWTLHNVTFFQDEVSRPLPEPSAVGVDDLDGDGLLELFWGSSQFVQPEVGSFTGARQMPRPASPGSPDMLKLGWGPLMNWSEPAPAALGESYASTTTTLNGRSVVVTLGSHLLPLAQVSGTSCFENLQPNGYPWFSFCDPTPPGSLFEYGAPTVTTPPIIGGPNDDGLITDRQPMAAREFFRWDRHWFAVSSTFPYTLWFGDEPTTGWDGVTPAWERGAWYDTSWTMSGFGSLPGYPFLFAQEIPRLPVPYRQPPTQETAWGIKELVLHGWSTALIVAHGDDEQYVTADGPPPGFLVPGVGLPGGTGLHRAEVWAPTNTSSDDVRLLGAGVPGLDALGQFRGLCTANLNGDAWPDVVVTGEWGTFPYVAANDIETTGHAIALRLHGTTSNPVGIGADVQAFTQDGRLLHHLIHHVDGSPRCSDDGTVFLPAEDQTLVDIEITWPSGAVQNLEDLAVDQIHNITEPATLLLARADRVLPTDGIATVTVTLDGRPLGADPMIPPTVTIPYYSGIGDQMSIGVPTQNPDLSWSVTLTAPLHQARGEQNVGETVLQVSFDAIHQLQIRPRVWLRDPTGIP